MEQKTTQTRDILGVPVVAATVDEAFAVLDDALSADGPVLVAFLNAHNSNLAAGNADFAAAMRAALVLNDGVGVDIASRLLHGRSFPANLNGTDFVPAYLAAT
ncbi:MAG TPA: glycosyltransferase, partial [Aquamicrobium sp.]|nr:glycosyltransferase [Aquamicrobium sp.]